MSKIIFSRKLYSHKLLSIEWNQTVNYRGLYFFSFITYNVLMIYVLHFITIRVERYNQNASILHRYLSCWYESVGMKMGPVSQAHRISSNFQNSVLHFKTTSFCCYTLLGKKNGIQLAKKESVLYFYKIRFINAILFLKKVPLSFPLILMWLVKKKNDFFYFALLGQQN